MQVNLNKIIETEVISDGETKTIYKYLFSNDENKITLTTEIKKDYMQGMDYDIEISSKQTKLE